MDEERVHFFSSPAELRAWLDKNHDRLDEAWIGFYRKGSGKPSITWPESVDEALCFGWIDGIRKSIDDSSYRIRFTPRRKTSTWSARNLVRMQELLASGRIRPSGLKAYQERDEKRSELYSFEQKNVELEPAQTKRFRANRAAWAFFAAEAPSYRRAAIWWVISAKRAETRERRLDQLISDSAQGLRIKQMRR